MEKEDLNYFSEREKKPMDKFKTLRNFFFLPVSKILVKLGFTANILSYVGLFILAGFVYYVVKNPLIASIFLLLHVLIDAFDGTVARLMKQDGNSGAFTDIVCDHTGMAIVMITLMWVNLVNPILASVYIYIYTILIIFIIVRNKMKVPIKFVIRTKYYLYILYGLYAFWGKNYIDLGVIIFIFLMIAPVFTSYFVIKKELK